MNGLERFGVYKFLPVDRIRTALPMTRWVPERFIRLVPPAKLGDVEVDMSRGEAVGEVWVSPQIDLQSIVWPKPLRRIEVIGVEGLTELPHPIDGIVMTDGRALELFFYFEALRYGAGIGRPMYKQKIAIGGDEAPWLSALARLLAREFGEMVLVGHQTFLPRLAGQIMAETGLSVRITRNFPDESFDKIIWCGRSVLEATGKSQPYPSAFRPIHPPEFSWETRSLSDPAIREIHSFAAAEAMLLALGGWEVPGRFPGLPSLGWIEHIAKLARNIGFIPQLEALDTPPPVGYNVNNS